MAELGGLAAIMQTFDDHARTELESLLGHEFRNADLLRQALTHSSLNETRRGRPFSYERLEFLGDRVLGLVVARLLYDRFPNEAEGALTRRQAALVRRETLARVASSLGFDRFMRLAAGDDPAAGQENPALLADTCESLIAALYLDGGIVAAGEFVRNHWQLLIEENPTPPRDAKTALQEWAQGRGLGLPRYTTTDRVGPDHAPTFTVRVELDADKAVDLQPRSAEARGASKRTAEQAAAAHLLEELSVPEQ
ncbi:MAG: ribonuclease III [Rhodospirillales bacterium]